MKFKFIGKSGTKDLDLAAYKIMHPDDELIHGQEIEIPDNLTVLIQRIRINGNYIVAPKKPEKQSKPKKFNKKQEKKKEDD